MPDRDPADLALGRVVAGGGPTAASNGGLAAACDAVANLRSMGFEPTHVVGALLARGGDASAAADACLVVGGGGGA